MTERTGKILLEKRSMVFASQCMCVGVYVCAHARVCACPDTHMPQDGRSLRCILSSLLPNT